jgi:hypothetical protein
MEAENQQKIIRFEDVKEKILTELKNRPNGLGIDETVSLIDGFVNQPFGKALSNSIVIGGPIIPMVMLLGKDTGRIYFFALKAILKDMDL